MADKLQVPLDVRSSSSSVSSFDIAANKTLQDTLLRPPPKNYVRLFDRDLEAVRKAIGAVRTDDERQTLLSPKSFIYPPKGLPSGLYKDVIHSRCMSQYQYYFSSLFFNLSLVLQLVLGAILTALTSSSTPKRIITILAASNTVVAGLLALMHNSGLPDRYKNDCTEFDGVEMHLQELMVSGLVVDGMSRDMVVENCYRLYRKAKGTVAKNKPAAYATHQSATHSRESLVGK